MANSYTYAKTTDLDDQISKLIDTAPDELNTFKELAEALGNNPNLATDVLKELNNKVNKEEGRGLSTNDFTNEEKEKLAELEKSDDAEMKLRDERLKYYGDPDIIPSDESYFNFVKNVDKNGNEDGTVTFYLVGNLAEICGRVIDLFVVPYKYIDENGKEYIVNTVGNDTFTHYDTNVSKFTKVILPDSIEIVLEKAFYQGYVNDVNVPKNLKIVKEDAFSLTPCFYNKKIIIPSSVIELGQNCFSGCWNNSSISFCANVKEIPYGCLSFHSNGIINILSPIEKMDISLYQYSNINDIKIPNTVEEITGFLNDSLAKTISFPSNLKELPDIRICENLETVIVKGKNTVIKKYTFNDCPNVVIHCCSGSKAEIYAVENNIPYELLDNPIINTATETSATDDSGNIITTYSVILEHDKEIRLGEMPNLTISTLGIPDTYKCSLTFTSGETPTSLTYSSTPIIWHGEDCSNDGYFIPAANKIYEISIKKINDKQNINYDLSWISTNVIKNPYGGDDVSLSNDIIAIAREAYDDIVVDGVTYSPSNLTAGAYYMDGSTVKSIQVFIYEVLLYWTDMDSGDEMSSPVQFYGYSSNDYDIPVGTVFSLSSIIEPVIVARVGEV